jgi:hypothetical protein
MLKQLCRLNHKILIFFLIVSSLAFSQRTKKRGFSNEIGFYGGATTFFTDFGERSYHTQVKNSSFHVGLVHFFNFAYRDDYGRYTKNRWFNDHIKVRSDVFFTYIGDLQHEGGLVDESQTSLTADQLRAMKGELGLLSLSTQIEYNPFSIRGFSDDIRNNFAIHPYIAVGIGYAAFNRNVSSSLGRIDTPASTPPVFLGGIRNGSSSEWSLVTNIGFRYKLTPMADLIVEGRWQAFFTDDIDGLDDNSTNSVEHADYLLSFSIGYVYYLNF